MRLVIEDVSAVAQYFSEKPEAMMVLAEALLDIEAKEPQAVVVLELGDGCLHANVFADDVEEVADGVADGLKKLDLDALGLEMHESF